MSLIPGPSGTKVQLVDGAQVDLISALTAGNGVQLEGRTSGVAIEAGKVGYWIQATVNTVASTPSLGTRYFVTDSLTLTAGSWEIVFFSKMVITTPSLNGWVNAYPGIYNTTDASELLVFGTVVDGYVSPGGVLSPDGTYMGSYHLSIPINISSTKSFQGFMTASNSSSLIGVVTNYNTGRFYAKRIA